MHVLPPHLSADLLRLLDEAATAHLGVMTRRRLSQLGITGHVLDAQLTARRWRRLGETVVALHNGPLTRAQEWSAAVQSCEAPCALAGRTAAEAGGLTGWEVEPIHIVVPRGAKVKDL